MKRRQLDNSQKSSPALAQVAKEGKKTAKRTTRRTADEQASYDKTMAALDHIIGKNADDALRELEEEEDEDNRPRTRARRKNN